jgi:hypothetical protein
MSRQNVGLCNTCSARVPAEFFERDGQIWIRKNCAEHGINESLVSTNAKIWLNKRDMWQYVEPEAKVCTLKCDKCRHDHKPNICFIDVTNHCNMNCPICIATVPGMGFDYNPPVSYFERIFAHVSQWDPKPIIQLFGGEPTVRDDLFDIIAAARKHGLRPNVTTNGVRLANEEYARKFCEQRIGVRFAFDGFDPDIYEKLRRNRPAYFKKLKGLENLKKFSRRKQTMIACAAWGINDHHIRGMIDYIHENADFISELAIIPLADTWDKEDFKEARPCTLEDVEKMVQIAVGGDEVEFIPAGLSYAMRIPRPFFRHNPRSELLLLAGVHPNCESMTVLVDDGKRYRGINHYLRVPLSKAAVEFASLCRKIEPRLKELDPKRRWQRLKGQWLVVRTLLGWVLRTFDFGKLTGGNPPLAMLKMLMEDLRYNFTRKGALDPGESRRRRRFLRVAMLPFEEQHSVDATRLENCKAVFPYEDADTGKINMIPACMWVPYRNDVLRKISEKYGVVDGKGRMKAPGTADLATQAAAPAGA